MIFYDIFVSIYYVYYYQNGAFNNAILLTYIFSILLKLYLIVMLINIFKIIIALRFKRRQEEREGWVGHG